MKAILFASLTMLAPMAQAKPLAVLQQSGGFCREACATTTITIEDNGQVAVARKSGTPAKVEKYVLAHVSSKVIVALKRDLELISPVKLVDNDPEAPICMDIPEVTYSVLKNDRWIPIGVDKNCHEYRLESFEGTGITTVLKSFLNLQNFAQ